jgi:hypothetical protein
MAEREIPPDFLALSDRELLAESTVHTYRASGPGGQKRNKTDSAVRIHHHPTGLIVVAPESRSQHENKARALRRLREAISLRIRRPVDLDSLDVAALAPECGSGERLFLIGRRDRRYRYVERFVLDVLAAAEGRLSEASSALNCSTGRLSRFLTDDKKLLDEANRLRRAHNHKPLRRR